MKRFLSLALLLSVSISYASDQFASLFLFISKASDCEKTFDNLELYRLVKNRDREGLNDFLKDLTILKKDYETNQPWYGTRSFSDTMISDIYVVHNKVAKRNDPEELALMKPFSELFGYIPGKNYNKQ